MFFVISFNENIFAQPAILSMKKLEKNFIKINDSLFANRYETSGELYMLFLKEQSKTDTNYSILEIDSVNWLLPQYFEAPFVELYQLHPAFQNHPVVNISYEAAISFCKWLTIKYNNFPKRKFQKVEIRLPSEEEWDLLYSYAASQKNYKQTKSNISAINAYKENHGFYNIISNVKEMTNKKGIAKGGDWTNGFEIEELSLHYKEKSLPIIGFRYFIDIIEK